MLVLDEGFASQYGPRVFAIACHRRFARSFDARVSSRISVAFLLPAGLMMGALDTLHPSRVVIELSRSVGIIFLCLGAATTTWVAVEYNMAERSLERVRFERNRAYPSRNSEAPDLLLLTQLREFCVICACHSG